MITKAYRDNISPIIHVECICGRKDFYYIYPEVKHWTWWKQKCRDCDRPRYSQEQIDVFEVLGFEP